MRLHQAHPLRPVGIGLRIKQEGEQLFLRHQSPVGVFVWLGRGHGRRGISSGCSNHFGSCGEGFFGKILLKAAVANPERETFLQGRPVRPARCLLRGPGESSGHQAGEGERQESAHGREQDEDARIAELDEAGDAVVTLTLDSGGLFRGPFHGGGKAHAAAAAEPLVDGFQFMDEVADFLAGVGAAGGIAEVGTAGKGAGIVNGATAVRTQQRAGAVRWQREFFLSGGAGGGVGHEGFAPGEKGGAAGQAEPAAFGAVQAIPVDGPLGEPGVDLPDLKEKGGTFCGSEASGHGEVSLGERWSRRTSGGDGGTSNVE